MKTSTSKMDTKLIRLMRDFDYDLQGRAIIRKGSPGFSSDRIILNNARSAFDAAEYICPIVADPEYTRRLIDIQNGN